MLSEICKHHNIDNICILRKLIVYYIIFDSMLTIQNIDAEPTVWILQIIHLLYYNTKGNNKSTGSPFQKKKIKKNSKHDQNLV